MKRKGFALEGGAVLALPSLSPISAQFHGQGHASPGLEAMEGLLGLTLPSRRAACSVCLDVPCRAEQIPHFTSQPGALP